MSNKLYKIYMNLTKTDNVLGIAFRQDIVLEIWKEVHKADCYIKNDISSSSIYVKGENTCVDINILMKSQK